jgi:hypothetical protein
MELRRRKIIIATNVDFNENASTRLNERNKGILNDPQQYLHATMQE